MCRNARKSLNAQTEIGVALSDKECPVTRASVARRAGWHINTLATYFPPKRETQPTKLPLGSLWDLLESGALPDDLAKLLLPDGLDYVRVPEGIDHNEVALAMTDYLAAKTAAHHPESEDGEAIGPNECKQLRGKVARIGGAS